MEEKKKREKEIVKEILQEAEEYKTEFYSKWKLRVENNKAAKREEEKVILIKITVLYQRCFKS